MYRNKKVGVLMGGPGSEREISLRTGQAVARALRETGYEVVELDLNEQTAARITAEGVEVVYNALHGKLGEDGCVQGLLEIMRVPYTGPGVLGSALGMDKIVSKKLFEDEGLPVPPYWTLRRTGSRNGVMESPFGWPVVVKPAAEGSSVAIAIAGNQYELEKALAEAFLYDECVVLEQYIPGREFSVAVLGERALGLVEIRPRKLEGETITFYDYKHKYTKGMTDYFTRPEGLDDNVVAQMQNLAVAAAQTVRAEGVVRVDFILDEQQQPWLLEVNTLPGLTELSLVPMIARDWQGMSFAELVETVLNTARLKIVMRG